MKKLIATLALASIAAGVFAQGNVSFANLTGGITTNAVLSPYSNAGQLNATTSGKTPATGGAFYFTLLYDTAGTPASANPLAAGWSQVTSNGVGVTGTTALNAGDMEGQAGAGAMTVDNWAAGQAGKFIIVGWSANLGTTWSQVAPELGALWAGLNPAGTYFFGVSPIDSATPTASPSPAAPLWTINGGTFALDEVVPTPEPATMALAALGGASLLLFRRKK